MNDANAYLCELTLGEKAATFKYKAGAVDPLPEISLSAEEYGHACSIFATKGAATVTVQIAGPMINFRRVFEGTSKRAKEDETPAERRVKALRDAKKWANDQLKNVYDSAAHAQYLAELDSEEDAA